MTINEAKALLDLNHIPFSEVHFNTVAEFRTHISPFTYLKNAEEYQVKVLVATSNNKQKNIELQFIDECNDGNYTFVDLYFGEYFYELFDCQKEVLRQAIIDEINSIILNNVIIIVSYDLSKEKWCGDVIFDKTKNDVLGLPYYEKVLRQIKEKKRFFSKLFGSKMQYEIFDWNTYQCIIK